MDAEVAEAPGGFWDDAPPFKAAFFFLVLFTINVYLRPQELIPALAPLRLAKVVAGLAFLSFCFGYFKYSERLPVKNWEVRLTILFALFILWSIPMSLWKGGSIAHFFSVSSKTFLIFFIIVFVVNRVERIRLLLFVLLSCGGFMAVYAAYQMKTGQGFYSDGRLILPGLSGDPNDRALVFVYMLPLAVFALFEIRSKLLKSYYAVLIVVYVLGIVQSLSRGGMLGLIAVGGMIALRLVRERKGVVVLLFLIAFVGVFFLPERFVTRATSLFDRSYDTRGTIDTRKDTMKAGLRLMLKNPIFGVGAGVFEVAEGRTHGGVGKWNAAHCSPLEVGAETGIFGLLAFLGLFYVSLKNCRRIQKDFIAYDQDPSMIEFARGVEVAIIGFFVSAFFLSQGYSWNLFYLLGLSGAMRRIAWQIEETHFPEEEEAEPEPEAPDYALSPQTQM